MRVWPNGGTAIFVRTVWITVLLYSCALLLRAVGYTDWSLGIDWQKLSSEVSETTTWLGAIFAAVYTALYARFSSQWSYLANVYHQIKAAILSGPPNPSPEQQQQLGFWKAAFVEDAEDLHLVRKKMFAMTAWEWLKDDSVKEKFDTYTAGGRRRRVRLQRRLRRELLKHDPTLQLPEVEDDERPIQPDPANPAEPDSGPESESDRATQTDPGR